MRSVHGEGKEDRFWVTIFYSNAKKDAYTFLWILLTIFFVVKKSYSSSYDKSLLEEVIGFLIAQILNSLIVLNIGKGTLSVLFKMAINSILITKCILKHKKEEALSLLIHY